MTRFFRRALVALLLVAGLGLPVFSQGTVIPAPVVQFFDNNGNPLDGGQLFSYAAGTLTPLATCTDNATPCTIPNTNPVVLDASGRAHIFLSAATYKFILKDRLGSTIWTQDNVFALAPYTIVNNIAAAVLPLTPQAATIATTGTITALPVTSGAFDYTIYMNNATLATIQGITPGAFWQRLRIFSIGAGQVDFVPLSGAVAAGTKILPFAQSGVTSLAPGVGVAEFVYDTSSRWRMVNHEQGAWITPPFNPLNYVTSGAMTWTVEAADVTTQRYWLRGRTLTVAITLELTSVAAPLGVELRIENLAYGVFFASGNAQTSNTFQLLDNGVGTSAYFQVNVGGTYIRCLKQSLGNFTAATNNTGLYGEITFEVQ